MWRDGRVAEGGGLLNRYTVKSRIGGSNPPLSAKLHLDQLKQGVLRFSPFPVLVECMQTVCGKEQPRTIVQDGKLPVSTWQWPRLSQNPSAAAAQRVQRHAAKQGGRRGDTGGSIRQRLRPRLRCIKPCGELCAVLCRVLQVVAGEEVEVLRQR